LLGALVALFGHQLNLIAWSQQPAILIGFAVIFVVLALHSFDLFELRLPQFIRGRVERVGQYGQSAKWSGSVIGCWVAGFFSALIVSPCLSAPLAGVLLSVSTVGNPWLGALALFCLGLGLGVPLMILGATEGRFLPKAGNWLNWVRRGFGLLLFGVALILLNRVFQTSWMLLLWAVLSGFFALWLWYWAGRGRLLSKVLSVLVGIFAVLQVVGAALGATDPIRPLSPLLVQKQTAQSVDTIYTLAQLRQYQQQHPHLLVELTADWCISCKIVERELFLQNPAPELQQWTRIKLDVSQTTPESRAVLKALNVFGPPALMLYQDGQQVEQLLGEPEPQAFRTVLQQHAP
jgi:thiol:disulfide interchange protein DsbD